MCMELENVLVILYHRLGKNEITKKNFEIIRQYHKRLGKFLMEYERRDKKNSGGTQ